MASDINNWRLLEWISEFQRHPFLFSSSLSLSDITRGDSYEDNSDKSSDVIWQLELIITDKLSESKSMS